MAKQVQIFRKIQIFYIYLLPLAKKDSIIVCDVFLIICCSLSEVKVLIRRSYLSGKNPEEKGGAMQLF